MDGVNNYTCICLSGFTGERCESGKVFQRLKYFIWNDLIFFLDHVAVALLFCLLMSLQLSPTQVCNLMIRLFSACKIVNHSILLRKLEHYGIPEVADF